PGQVQRVPGRRVAEDRAADPRVGGEDEVAQGLDEGPLAVDGLVQQRGVQAAGPGDGAVPEPVEGVPGGPEAGRCCGAHRGPVRVAPVQLGVDQRCDVDTVDRDVEDLAVDVDVGQLDPAHHHAVQRDPAEPGTGQVAGPELGAGEVGPLEP